MLKRKYARKTERGEKGNMKRFSLALLLAIGGLAIPASPAAASVTPVTIGQLADFPTTCNLQFDALQPTVTSGTSYVVPSMGGVSSWRVTSWSNTARADPGQMLTMKMFRKVGDPARYQAVAHDGPRPLRPSELNTFPISIPAKAGDVLGLNSANAPTPQNGCADGASDQYLISFTDLADGAFADFSPNPNFRLNISATLVPANDFTFGPITRNKKKGTATLTVHVPNPGGLLLTGKGLRVVATTAGGPGDVELKIKAYKTKREKLTETGKVKVRPKVTYTPAFGDPNTESTKVKLLLKKL